MNNIRADPPPSASKGKGNDKDDTKSTASDLSRNDPENLPEQNAQDQKGVKDASEKDKVWPNAWSDFLETCRREAQETKLENRPWVCACGKAVCIGSPHDAGTRTGNSLWSHILGNIGTESHPGQSDIDRWEEKVRTLKRKKSANGEVWRMRSLTLRNLI